MSFLVRVRMFDVLIYYFFLVVMMFVDHLSSMMVVFDDHTIVLVMPICVPRATSINNGRGIYNHWTVFIFDNPHAVRYVDSTSRYKCR